MHSYNFCLARLAEVFKSIFFITFCFEMRDVGKRVITLDHRNTKLKKKRFDISATSWTSPKGANQFLM